jgi:endoglucanase
VCAAVLLAAVAAVPTGVAVAAPALPTIAEATEGWETQVQDGSVSLVSDTNEFASGPKSLRLETGPEGGEGQAVYRVEIEPGQKLALRGSIFSTGAIEYAAIALLSADSATPWQEITRLDGLTTWDTFAGEVTVPDDTRIFFIAVAIKGKGKVWFDDLEFVSPDDVEKPTVLATFNKKPNVAYEAFEGKVDAAEGVLHINADSGQGGAIYFINGDFSAHADQMPTIRARLGDANKARQIRLQFIDADEKQTTFTYDISGLNTQVFEVRRPLDNQALGGGEFDPAKLSSVQVQGNWRAEPIELFVDEIAFAPAEVANEEAVDLEATMAAITRGEGSPQIQHISAVAPDVVAVTIDAQQVTMLEPEPYVEAEGDVIRTSGPDVLVWDDGEVVTEPRLQVLHRINEAGVLVPYGEYAEPYGDYEPILVRTVTTGDPLTIETVEAPAAYRIAGGQWSEPTQPVDVWIKSRPTDKNTLDQSKSYRHVVYLKLAEPLTEGVEYKLSFPGINTQAAEVSYTHNSRSTRSESVHATHLGYRPGDPYKRAYLSLWAGTGGGQTFEVDTFELIDNATDQTVFTGNVELGFPAGRDEQMNVVRNHVGADVFYLDFSDFQTPGEYRVFVPGVGCSYPLSIGDDVYIEPFKTSMHGYLTHRSGIALGQPLTNYERPRPMHPDDGVKIYEIDTTRLLAAPAPVQRELAQIFEEGGLEALKARETDDAWGGYMDAGDWDRRSQHLASTYDHLELLDLYPEFFENLELALPANEANDELPDILNEALWNLDCYRRMQEDDGGIRGGIESTEHPRTAEASWQETLLIAALGPDPVSSHQYAANAAKAGRLIAKYDEALSKEYIDTAIRAFDWAVANADRIFEQEAKRGDEFNENSSRSELAEWAPVAAIELYHATGDERFHDAAKSMDAFGNFDPNNPGQHWLAKYAYAALPDELGDDGLRQRSIAAVEGTAQIAIDFADGNAFGITTLAPGVPMMGYLSYYSVPEMAVGAVLPRAFALTGEEKYLHAALVAANYPFGANPLNMTFTTGMGHDYPRAPLHIDSRMTAQEPPAGITVYGPYNADGGFAFDGWVHQWHLNEMQPGSRTWPSAEWYVDLYLFPSMNEYTVHQSFRPTNFYLGFLAAREGR